MALPNRLVTYRVRPEASLPDRNYVRCMLLGPQQPLLMGYPAGVANDAWDFIDIDNLCAYLYRLSRKFITFAILAN